MSDTAYNRAISLALESADAMEAGRPFNASEAAASLRFLASEIQDYREALDQEREYNAGLTQDCEEMVQRLDRLHDHLRHGVVMDVMRKLADYAGGFADFERGIAYDERGNPPPDPFPEPPEPPKRKRRAKS